MYNPKISVITINYNGAAYIEQTITTVLQQAYSNYEYIIIDGASTDNSINIITRYETELTYFLSEPDHGIADAMNKGINHATGDFILFLHSDDYLLSGNSLILASEELDNNHDIFTYPIRFGNKKSSHVHYPRGFNYWINFKTGIYHQATLCRHELFNKIGVFDTNFKITMDYDFFLRAYRENCKIKNCSAEFVFMRDTGISGKQDKVSLNNRFDEEKAVHKKNCNSILLNILYKIYWPFYRLYRFTL